MSIYKGIVNINSVTGSPVGVIIEKKSINLKLELEEELVRVKEKHQVEVLKVKNLGLV